MLTRILAVALAAGSLVCATAQAQTGTGTLGNSTSDKTRPSTAPTTALSDSDRIHQPTAANSDKTRPSGGAMAHPIAANQAHQAMAPSSETTKPSGLTTETPESSASNLAHQPMAPSSETTRPSGLTIQSSSSSHASSFDPSQYKTKTECPNVASAACVD